MLCNGLHLDLYFYTAGEFQLHQSIDGLGIAAVNVYKTLVGRNLELFAGLLVDEGGTVYGNDALAGGKGHRTTDDGSGSLYRLNDLLSRLFYENVIVTLQFDTDFLTHDNKCNEDIILKGFRPVKSHSLTGRRNKNQLWWAYGTPP